MKKRVAIVTNGGLPSYNAHSINSIKHAEAFRELGYFVEVFTPLRIKEFFLLKKIDFYKHYGIKYVKVNFFTDYLFFLRDIFPFYIIQKFLNTFNFSFSNYFTIEKKISNTIKSKKIDLCYARSYKILKFNVMNEINTIIEIHKHNPKTIYNIDELVFFSKSKYFLFFVTIHYKIKNELVKLGVDSAKIMVLEDAVSSNFYKKTIKNNLYQKKFLNIPANKFIITYCGSLKKGKGIKTIIEISNHLKNKKDIFFMILGGTKKEIDFYSKFSQNHNLKFFGHISGNMVPNYLKLSDLLLLVYDRSEKNPVMDYETTSPIKLFEYLATGVPIFSSRLQTIQKVFKLDPHLIYFHSETKNIHLELLDMISKIDIHKQNSLERIRFSKKFTYKNRIRSMIEKLN